MSAFKKRIDLTGQRFGRWTVIDFAHTDRGLKARWLCYCDCGTEKDVYSQSLRSGASLNCGCVSRKLTKDRATIHGHTANYQRSPEYRSWLSMIARCESPKHSSYKNYGARGIVVCERWRNSFEAFLADMGLKPTPKHTIDRIDNNKGYHPENCRWATWEVQNNSQRRKAA